MQTYAGCQPGTMVVHFQDASAARGAVMGAVGLTISTLFAIPGSTGRRDSDGMTKGMLGVGFDAREMGIAFVASVCLFLRIGGRSRVGENRDGIGDVE